MASPEPHDRPLARNGEDGGTCQIWQVFTKTRAYAGSILRRHYSTFLYFRQLAIGTCQIRQVLLSIASKPVALRFRA
jgi:hypothetical protein